VKSNFPLPGLYWLVLPLLLPFLSLAQSSLAMQGGLNLSNATVTGPTPFVASAQGNFFVGGSARHPLQRQWTISGDAQYTRRGFFLYPVDLSSEKPIAFRLNYVELAVRMEYHVLKNVHLQLGGYGGYRTAGYVRVTGANALTQPIHARTNPVDVGLQGGVAAYFRRWSAFVRYSHGLKAAAELNITDENGQVLGSLRMFNRGLQIGVGYTVFAP